MVRRRPSIVLLASVIAPAAFLAAGAADIQPAPSGDAVAAADDASPLAFEIVEAASLAPSASPIVGQISMSSGSDTMIAASRYRTVDRALPAGIAPERGLQVRTILASRAISAAFPEIHNIGGVRPDALRWHPNGLALDVMIPNPSSPEGIALGNQIVSYALRNKDRFDLQDCIWRGVYYTPGGAKAGGYGHFDHVHITTHGGGYPTGGETYFR